MFHKSTRPKDFRLTDLTKEEIEKAVKESINFTQLIRNLGVADGDPIRLKLKNIIEKHNISIAHFLKGRGKLPTPDAVKKERRKETHRKSKERLRKLRKDPKYRAKFVLNDGRKADRRRGLSETDLSLEEVECLISNSCQYCGETELMMTLDRIDNSMGHLKSNVIPCCIRCNLLRRDMPYQAWVEFIPTLKAVRESGKFENWTGALHKGSTKNN